MDPRTLPVYQQRDRILEALDGHQAIVVESPTGSGKTTQMPIIFHEAGFSKQGIIGVTQPRRIAAISVSEFIAKQLGTMLPGLVGYKMRFEDLTDNSTEIKIMTDGILLQEMKLDPMLSRYSLIMVDEAHERSLNIDFILGLLKRVLEARPEFKAIVSSATINAQVFSEYFGECPIVKIDSQVFPVAMVYDHPWSGSMNSEDALLSKIEEIVNRIVAEGREGDILVFLPGEKAIKQCLSRLSSCEVNSRLHLVPLYARLGKEEQEKVFDPCPAGLTKVVVATNIAETSVTIDGLTSVIDSGLAKLSYYNSRTYTASLIETPISKASCNQRKGRAGRTRPGTCYRLYSRKDFENRILFTPEEIYRTDLSEVVLRMAELGITDFESFDFISQPEKEAVRSAIESLSLLDALSPERTLTKIGTMMCAFPLLPRHSRIIVEAILAHPQVVEEALIAAAFLSTQSPYVLPPGEEMEARKAHHSFRDPAGDFVSYLKLYRTYKEVSSKARFCERNYLDERAMAEIDNVKNQLEIIVSSLGVPILSGGSLEDYLCSVAKGLIQFVCVRDGRDFYRSLTAERIQIHPGSVMYHEDPMFIVAGEVVKTTRMYAMSVSPLQKTWLSKISPLFSRGLLEADERAAKRQLVPGAQREFRVTRDFTNRIKIGSEVFRIEKWKGDRKLVILEWGRLKKIGKEVNRDTLSLYMDLRGTIRFGRNDLLLGEKLDLILKVAPVLELGGKATQSKFPKRNYDSREDSEKLIQSLDYVLRVTKAGSKGKDLGFVGLFTDSNGNYWFKVSRGFLTAVNESLASLESLVDEIGDSASHEDKEKVSALYRKLSSFYA